MRSVECVTNESFLVLTLLDISHLIRKLFMIQIYILVRGSWDKFLLVRFLNSIKSLLEPVELIWKELHTEHMDSSKVLIFTAKKYINHVSTTIILILVLNLLKLHVVD